MFYYLDLLSVGLVFIISLFSFKFSIQKYGFSLNRFNSLIYLIWGLVLSFIAIEGLALYNAIYWFIIDKYSWVLLALLHSIILYQLAFLSIKELTNKKISTLWRLPIIASLLGVFEPNMQLYVHLGLSLIICIVYYLNRKILVFSSSSFIKSIILVILLSFLNQFGLWYLNLVIFCMILFNKQGWDLVFAKYTGWKKLGSDIEN